jgi:histone-lysine N-methyltransferase SETD3
MSAPPSAPPAAVQDLAEIFTAYTQVCRDSLGVKVNFDLSVSHLSADKQDPNWQERGVFCSTPVPDKAVLVSVPFDSLLSVEVARQRPELAPLLGNESLEMREEDILSLLLLMEKSKGDQSKWHKHIEVLPTHYHNVMYFEGLQLEAMKGCNLYVIAQQLQRQIDDDFARFGPACTEWLVGQGFPADTFTKEGYKWCLATIWSRFVSIVRKGQDYKIMAPFFDMFNHDSSASVQHGFDAGSDQLLIQTLQPWDAGVEININYGALSDHKCLMLYGFIPEGNVHNSVDLWAAMSDAAEDFALKQQVLRAHNVDTNRPFPLYATEINRNLLANLRVQRMDANAQLRFVEHAFSVDTAVRTGPEEAGGVPEENEDGCGDGVGNGGMLSFANEELVMEMLMGALRGMLDAFANPSVEDDEQLLAAWAKQAGEGEGGKGDRHELPVPEYHEQMAVALRCGDKKILHANIAMVTARQEAVKAAAAAVKQNTLARKAAEEKQAAEDETQEKAAVQAAWDEGAD